MLLNRMQHILHDYIKLDNHAEVGLALRVLLHETIEVLETKTKGEQYGEEEDKQEREVKHRV